MEFKRRRASLPILGKRLKGKEEKRERYVLLSAKGFRSELAFALNEPAAPLGSPLLARYGLRDAISSNETPRLHSLPPTDSKVKLVELTDSERRSLEESDPEVRAVPVVYYDLAHVARMKIAAPARVASANMTPPLQISVLERGTGKPVAGAEVIAFTNFAARQGAEACTDDTGTATLNLTSSPAALDALLVYPPAGYWGFFARQVTLPANSISLAALDLTVPDFLQDTYGAAPLNAGAGVKVGVIDTGVDSIHPHLRIAGGSVFVTDEQNAGSFGPATAKNGEHGTHVAGIIAARGRPPSGRGGIAPGVSLMSYRVFPNAGGGAMNFDIVRAIEQAVADRCDLVNISIQLGSPDEAVRSAVEGALQSGTVCLAAAGNDCRKPVSYPAKYAQTLAISAIGKQGTFPVDSSETADVMAPYGASDPAIFVAAFSNVGAEISATAPGVGIVSTLPGGLYGVMSGTSMACPAVTGLLAARLAGETALLQSPRDSLRSSKIKDLLNQRLQPLGLGANFEGRGLVR